MPLYCEFIMLYHRRRLLEMSMGAIFFPFHRFFFSCLPPSFPPFLSINPPFPLFHFISHPPSTFSQFSSSNFLALSPLLFLPFLSLPLVNPASESGERYKLPQRVRRSPTAKGLVVHSVAETFPLAHWPVLCLTSQN